MFHPLVEGTLTPGPPLPPHLSGDATAAGGPPGGADPFWASRQPKAGVPTRKEGMARLRGGGGHDDQGSLPGREGVKRVRGLQGGLTRPSGKVTAEEGPRPSEHDETEQSQQQQRQQQLDSPSQEQGEGSCISFRVLRSRHKERCFGLVVLVRGRAVLGWTVSGGRGRAVTGCPE